MQHLFEVFKAWIPSGMLVILGDNNFDGENNFLILIKNNYTACIYKHTHLHTHI